MTDDEAIRLSEAPILDGPGQQLLQSVQTDWYIIVVSSKKGALTKTLGHLLDSRAIYWRANIVSGVQQHKIIIKDDAKASLFRLFATDEVRQLTIGELAEARDEIALPWLPNIVGYRGDRKHNEAVRAIRSALGTASWNAKSIGAGDLTKAIEACSATASSMTRKCP